MMQMVPFNKNKDSIEFHGTWSASISLTRAVPWNSVEFGARQFHWHENVDGWFDRGSDGHTIPLSNRSVSHDYLVECSRRR